MYIEIEYFHEHIVGGACRLSTGLEHWKGQRCLGTLYKTAYVDLLLDKTLSGGVQKYHASRSRQMRN